MGSETRTDLAAARDVASEFDVSAGILDLAARTKLSRLGFGDATAGRAYHVFFTRPR